jgi:TPR repeat protein
MGSIRKNMSKILTIILAFIIQLHASKFEDGMDAFENKNYNKAFTIMKELVDDSGNKYAKAYLAEMYTVGLGTKTNYKLAFKLAKSAADNGSSMAAYTLGKLYVNGKGVNKDIKLAIFYFEQYLARNKNGNVASWVGQVYKSGEGITKDYNKALKYFKIADEKLHTAKTEFWVGYAYEQLGNKILAYEWYFKSSKHGYFGATLLIKELCKKDAWACK